MSTLTKTVIGGLFVLCCTAIILYFFLRSQVIKSFPTTEGHVNVPGLHKAVDVYRDELGVPHISAHDEHDLFFSLGYVHAQDRLWQMELTRRAGEGRLSELFKETTLPFDKLFRTLRLYSLADTLERYLHPNARRMLGDYSEGVNAFIDSHKGSYPIEFDMLNIEPEHWTVQHSLLISRLMAWELNFSWWVKLTYAELAQRLPESKFQEISLNYPSAVPPITTPLKDGGKLVGAVSFMEAVRSYRDFFHTGPFSAGSNAWVVDSSKSLRGKPILANDPHLKISVPSKWYEAHLTAPGWNVAGVTIPGTPVVIIGHNDSLAWGLTSAMLDDADFFVEEVDTLKPNKYKFGTGFLPMEVREEVIRVGSSDSITLVTRSTHHGPIITDVHPGLRGDINDSLSHLPLSFRWVGSDISDEFNAFYRMNRANNRIEFEHGLQELGAPAQCVVYADARGNIGSWLAGKVPVRSKQAASMLLNGPKGADEWKGYVPFEKLPKVWNPPQGYIISANQPVADKSYPYYLSNLWEPPYRAERIRELIGNAEQLTKEDFEQFQQDVLSTHAKKISPLLIRICGEDSNATAEVHSALEYLKNWDFRCTRISVAASLFNVFFVKLLHNTYEDEMGETLFNDFVYFTAIPYRVTDQLLSADSSMWFDNVQTVDIETKEDIVRKSFQDALKELTSQLGPEMKQWQWGSIHHALFSHLFSKRKPLDKVFSVGPFPIGGSASTVNKAEFSVSFSYDLYTGPSMRQIVDFAEPEKASMVITLGQSGQPLQEHYDDQVSLWLNGGYHIETLDWSAITKLPWKHLVLHPQN